MYEIPNFGLRAYALFYSKHGLKEAFKQSDLDWIVGTSMKKKIFSVLLNAGWIKKISRQEYKCVSPENIFSQLLDFKFVEIIKKSIKPYAFTGLSAIEVWSDFSYVQRGQERSPYFIKILKKNVKYWKNFFNENSIPNYINKGSTIGEFVILIPTNKLNFVEKDGLKLDSLKITIKIAEKNEMFRYPYEYMRNKYRKK